MTRAKDTNPVNPVNLTGKMIKKYRDENGFTQLDLAKHPRLNYKYSNFIGMLESGRSEFPLKRWEDFAEAIEADKTEFMVAALTDIFPNMKEYLAPLLTNKSND